jgi:hypothetical protein
LESSWIPKLIPFGIIFIYLFILLFKKSFILFIFFLPQFLIKEWVCNFCHNDEMEFSLHKTINITRAGKHALIQVTLPQGKTKEKTKQTKITCPETMYS